MAAVADAEGLFFADAITNEFLHTKVAQKNDFTKSRPVRSPKYRGGCSIIRTGGISRNTVMPAVVAVDMDFVERAVGQAVGIHGVGQEDAPHALTVLLQPQFGALPVVEVAEQIDILRGGQPLAEPPPRKRVVVLPPVVAVAVGVVDNRTGRAANLVHAVEIEAVAVVEFTLDGSQPFVVLDDGQVLAYFVRCAHNSIIFVTQI